MKILDDIGITLLLSKLKSYISSLVNPKLDKPVQDGNVNDVLVCNQDQSTRWVTFISLPQVTGEDNGKIIKVINGEWAIATLVDETYYISDESDNLLTDEENNSLIIQ